MGVFANPRSLRWLGLALLLTGVVAFLGVRALFLDHWIAVVMFDAIGWVTGAAYAAISLAGMGAALLLSTVLIRPRPASA